VWHDQGSTWAYADQWDPAAYLTMMEGRLRLIHQLLAPDGSLYVHCDWHSMAYLRLLLDEIFGPAQFQNEICWSYRTQGASRRRFGRKHDTLLFYTKGTRWTFHPQTERSYMRHRYGFAKADFKVDEQGRQYRDALLRDVWELPALQSSTHENLGYATQKPEALLERIIACSSDPGDLVADFFCGAGTTPAVAQRLGRRWLGCDQSAWAIHTTRKRLLALDSGFTLHQQDPAPVATLGLRYQVGPDYQIQVELSATDPVQVDYWAIAYQPGVVDWASFRTRRQQQLVLISPPHALPGPGTYVLGIWVVDTQAQVLFQELSVVMPPQLGPPRAWP